MQNTETNASATVEDRVVRGPEAETMSGCNDMQRRRLEERGLFPKRFKLNPAGGPRGSYGYSYREIRDWIEARLASRETAAVVVVLAVVSVAAHSLAKFLLA